MLFVWFLTRDSSVRLGVPTFYSCYIVIVSHPGLHHTGRPLWRSVPNLPPQYPTTVKISHTDGHIWIFNKETPYLISSLDFFKCLLPLTLTRNLILRANQFHQEPTQPTSSCPIHAITPCPTTCSSKTNYYGSSNPSSFTRSEWNLKE